MAAYPYNTATWQKLRRAHLARFPFCEGCDASGRKYVIANTVDHRIAISQGGNPFPGHDGLASYCPSCHSAKTARGAEAGAIKSTKPRRGCNADGTPIDPDHPWNNAVPLPRSVIVIRKSLKAAQGRPAGDIKTQLVSKRNLNG